MKTWYRKYVWQECPDCHKKYPLTRSLKVRDPNNEVHTIQVKVTKCDFCGTHLIRRVKKTREIVKEGTIIHEG